MSYFEQTRKLTKLASELITLKEVSEVVVDNCKLSVKTVDGSDLFVQFDDFEEGVVTVTYIPYYEEEPYQKLNYDSFECPDLESAVEPIYKKLVPSL